MPDTGELRPRRPLGNRFGRSRLARRDWFRLLDEVAAGAVVSIERGGRTILLQRAPVPRGAEAVPDYSRLIRAPNARDADRWSWDWQGGEGDLEPVDGGAS
jgi:hypothetical protein